MWVVQGRSGRYDFPGEVGGINTTVPFPSRLRSTEPPSTPALTEASQAWTIWLGDGGIVLSSYTPGGLEEEKDLMQAAELSTSKSKRPLGMDLATRVSRPAHGPLQAPVLLFRPPRG